MPLKNATTAPYAQDTLNAFIMRIREVFGIQFLTIKCHVDTPYDWTLTIFHGKAPKQSVATYEADSPSTLRYTPRQRFQIIMAGTYGYCFVAATKNDRFKLLSTLNGTIFPNKSFDAPIELVDLDLEVIRTLNAATRHPMNNYLPWTHLSLKFVRNSGDAFGNDMQIHYFSSEDGFIKMEINAFKWPKYALEARLECKIQNRHDTFSIGLFNHTGLMNVCLTAETLPAIAEIANLCSGRPRIYHPKSSTDPVQMTLF